MTYAPLDLEDYLYEMATHSRSITDSMQSATITIDKTTTPDYFVPIQSIKPDDDSVERCLFLGIIPGKQYVYAASADKVTMTGFSYEWFLSRQYLDTTEYQSWVAYSNNLITSYENPTNIIKKLLFAWTQNATTGVLTPDYTDRKAGIYHTETGGGTIDDVPNWGLHTGDAGYDSTKPTVEKKQFVFDPKQTKLQAIEEVAKYCNMVFLVKPVSIDGVWYPEFFWVHENDVDTKLDLPSTVYITAHSSDDTVESGREVIADQSEMYNRVRVTLGNRFNGINASTDLYYYGTAETAAVTAGTVPAIEYQIELADIIQSTDTTDTLCQAKADAKAAELLDLFESQNTTYRFSMKKRFDLEVYQKVRFDWFDGVPDDEDLRIISIEHNIQGLKGYTTITCTHDQRWALSRSLTRLLGQDIQREAQITKTNVLIDIATIEHATCTTIGAGKGIAKLSSGEGYAYFIPLNQ